MTSFGNFRDSTWASDVCRGSCSVIYGGQYATTAGFIRHSCSSGIQSSGFIGFWCDWSYDGSVMMIGGGGSNCGRSDHGIGITETGSARFSANYNDAYDFGNDGNQAPPTTYSLNLWVR